MKKSENNFEKYIDEVQNMKTQVYQDFLKSDFENYTEFLKNDSKKLKLKLKGPAVKNDFID